MIKKSVFVFIILLALYELIIRIFPVQWDTSQNDKSANLISAQNFIYNAPGKKVKNDTVIVGSSISRKLITGIFGNNYLNISFNGWGSLDGLELIKRTGKIPSCVLVETNEIGEPDLKEGIKSSLEPLVYYPNTLLRSFQLRNQPTGVLIGFLKNLMKEKIAEAKRKKRENTELYNYNLNMIQNGFSKEIPDSLLKKRFYALKELVADLEKQGMGIIFFEIPMSPTLENTLQIATTRNYFHQFFPDTLYQYILLPKVNNYIYSDGIHLTAESAIEYTYYLKNEISKLDH